MNTDKGDNPEIEKKNVCVVVLGDIGRSPRMQYHSLSLAEQGHKVDIIGYGETQPINELKAAPLVFYHYLVPCPQIPIRLLNYVFKTIFQSINLFFMLCIARKPEVLIVQNPPAIPALVVCWIFCRFVGAKYIIDWHNYSHTILALNLRQDNFLVKLTKKVEFFIGKECANAHFCVSNEMRKDLRDKLHISAVTLYDRPPEIFHPITLEEKHEFLLKLGKVYNQLLSEDGSTIFTKIVDGKVQLKANRPGILISSTSWTEDEDFSVLFSALQEYENQHSSGNQKNLPQLLCFITGKGHLKEFYTKKIAEQNWKHVHVFTPWLEAEDYPLMLASADLGVCLHTSSSGLDLPMKVVDMFGCCLPVCAYDYRCLHELVKHEKNSYTFKTFQELSSQLLSWFEDFPNNEKQKSIENKFKTELEVFQGLRWRENWLKTAYWEYLCDCEFEENVFMYYVAYVGIPCFAFLTVAACIGIWEKFL